MTSAVTNNEDGSVDTKQLAEEKGLDLPLIESCTRAQTIEDGVLIDVTETTKEAGFRFPVAVTSEVWHGYVSPHHAVVFGAKNSCTRLSLVNQPAPKTVD